MINETNSDFIHVIDELSRIDKAAEGFASGLEEEKAKLLSDFQKKRAALEKDFLEQGRRKNLAYREELRAENEKQIEKMHADSEEYIASLERAFKAHHMEWADELMQKVISEI